MLNNKPLHRFRMAGFAEGLSLLILVLIAMPLKYIAGIPEVVSVVGALHGFFFIAYALIALYTTYKVRWSFLWLASAFVVAFIPFGNFWLDHRIKQSFY
ncbi:DUF3817 domain-containing protein [Halobacillus campisalis]|uniref:DUF3817 domain-containing protein n=1 Tax=Halobacillus campisalis TaxID=435909 RepID=A0ABW2K7M9_9BACI|nr:DUF3817 domain-containing protein [Halobacillus campisalis]